MSAVRGLEPGKRAALVVNEMQNAIANPAHIDTPLAGQVTARGIVARINTLTAAFRAAGAPVIFCTIAARTPDWDGFLDPERVAQGMLENVWDELASP